MNRSDFLKRASSSGAGIEAVKLTHSLLTHTSLLLIREETRNIT